MSDSGGQEQLQHEIASLGVEEILALCYYAREGRPERLRLYMDSLRRRGGERAQFASCLLCYDLARHGDASAQREFPLLADSMREIAGHGELVESLVGQDPYLSFIWELCREQLTELDPRVDPLDQTEAVLEADDVTVVELLSDSDFADTPELQFDIDDLALRARLDAAVDRFLGKIEGMPIYDPEAGFRLDHRDDTERAEAFLRELDSLRDLVPAARGYRGLMMLFYGSRLRSKNLFGARNERKEDLLRGGVAEFLASPEELGQIAGVLNPSHASPTVWPKIADILLDFVHCLAVDRGEVLAVLRRYEVIDRLVVRDQKRRRRR